MTPSPTESRSARDMLAELVAARSPNPPGDESAVATVVERMADRLGLPSPRRYARRPERPNLMLDIGRGEPRLLLAAHMDTMPPGPADAWESDPFLLTETDERLVGLGSADMKAAIVAMLQAGARLVDQPPPRGTVTLAFTADEERGSQDGMAWLCAEGMIEADAAVMTEPSSIGSRSWDALYIAQRGSCVVRVVASGVPGHSGEPIDPGKRAGTAFARLLHALTTAELFPGLRHSVDGTPPISNVATMVGGGEVPFAHPAELHAIVEVRTIAGMSERQVHEALQLAIEPLELDGRVRVEPGPAPSWIPPGETVVDARLLRAAELSWRDTLGVAPMRAVLPAGTDSSHVDALGIPALPAFGPGSLAEAHRPNESIAAADLGVAVDLFERLARN